MEIAIARIAAVRMATSTSVSVTVDIPAKPHQPLTFQYPKRSFGVKKVVQCSFKPSWFAKWPFLHYIESKDVVFCHTCLLGFKLKRMRTNSADPAFVSHYLCYIDTCTTTQYCNDQMLATALVYCRLLL